MGYDKLFLYCTYFADMVGGGGEQRQITLTICTA